jgi:hypothetical protein
MVTAWDLAGRPGYGRVPAVSERSSRAGPGRNVASFLAPPLLSGVFRATFLRGQLAWENGALVGAARGRYIARPTAAR